MATPLEIAQGRLDAYIQREATILAAGQETHIDDRRRRDADLAEIRRAIKDLQNEVATLQGQASGTSRLIQGVPA